ncbi:MAG: cytochrome B6-F complex subunit VI (PetL) [Symploca sp. SIO1A3]|nr:cytochrome B6-F complex subunit VI (PetL) [Symploca sp. SIO1A3]
MFGVIAYFGILAGAVGVALVLFFGLKAVKLI